MAVDPTTLDLVTILGLPALPATPVTQANREDIYLGADSEIGTPASYKMSIEELRTLLDIPPGGATVSVNVPSHGVPALTNGVPAPVRQALGSVIAADSSDPGDFHVAYVVGIEDADNLILQTSGPHVVPSGHGLSPGNYYYLQDDGSVAITPAASNTVPVWYVWDAETLLLTPPEVVGGGQSISFAAALPANTAGADGDIVYITGGEFEGAILQKTSGFWDDYPNTFQGNWTIAHRDTDPVLPAGEMVGFKWELVRQTDSTLNGEWYWNGTNAEQLTTSGSGDISVGTGIAPIPGWVAPSNLVVDRDLDGAGTVQDALRVLATLVTDLRNAGYLTN